MHDLVSNLTKFISKEFTLCHEDDCSREILKKTRHFSYSSHNFDMKKFETFHRAKRLRTIIKINYGDFETKFLLPKIRCLRVLFLSYYRGLSKLPDEIGKFKQLRYLDLTYNEIKKLPDSMCKLLNLQILNLSHCGSLVALPGDLHKLINLQILDLSHCEVLAALPRDVHKLINLCHLDITRTKIMEMPINLGKLKCLQTLPTFIVSKRNRSGIEELGKLKNLQRSLSVLELQNIESPADAKDVNLRDKYLEELELKWGDDTATALESHKGVLHCLEPHSILRSLSIYGYGGTSFPNWVGDASFSNIASLRLEYCNFCCSLPPLGQLPSLQHLWIVGLDGIVTAGGQFYGSGSSSVKPFGALKYLRFENMLEWKEWFPFEAENECGAFPNLRELSIDGCPKLTGELPVHLPSLVELSIHDCPQLVASLHGASSLREVKVENCKKFLLNELSFGTSSRHEVRLVNCNTVILNESSIGIHELIIENCKKFLLKESSSGTSSQHEVKFANCNTVKFNESLIGHKLTIEFCSMLEFPMHLSYSSLEYLRLHVCSSLKSLPLFSKIRELNILNCRDLESLTVGEQHEHDLLILSLMQMYNCPNFAYFPQGGLCAPNLKDFKIRKCRSLRSLPDKMHILLPSLEKLEIDDCPQVESFPDGGLPSNLNEISIFNCNKLFANRMGWGLQNLSCVRRFSIHGKYEDVESFPDEGFLPTSLTYLNIEYFPNLKSLEKKGFQHLTALEELMIESCPKLERMPKDGLPPSLSTIKIGECPLLTKELERKEGPEWRKIANVPNKYIR